MKVLCVCDAGMVRSVALANLAKADGHDALAVGLAYAGADTVALLCRWAERILVVDPAMAAALPSHARRKVTVYPVGEWPEAGPEDAALSAALKTHYRADPKWAGSRTS